MRPGGAAPESGAVPNTAGLRSRIWAEGTVTRRNSIRRPQGMGRISSSGKPEAAAAAVQGTVSGV